MIKTQHNYKELYETEFKGYKWGEEYILTIEDRCTFKNIDEILHSISHMELNAIGRYMNNLRVDCNYLEKIRKIHYKLLNIQELLNKMREEYKKESPEEEKMTYYLNNIHVLYRSTLRKTTTKDMTWVQLIEYLEESIQYKINTVNEFLNQATIPARGNETIVKPSENNYY